MWKENFHRGLGRYGLGSVRVPPLILPQKTGVLPDRRPSEGMLPRFPIVPRRNPWLVWLAEVMLRPTLWLYALGLLRSGGGGMPWAGWDAKRCGPPLFSLSFFIIMTCSCSPSTRGFWCWLTSTSPLVLNLNQLLGVNVHVLSCARWQFLTSYHSR